MKRKNFKMKYCWKTGGRTETNGGFLQNETENEYEISKIQRKTPVPVSFLKRDSKTCVLM